MESLAMPALAQAMSTPNLGCKARLALSSPYDVGIAVPHDSSCAHVLSLLEIVSL
jgi:hypothetical protein